MAIFNADYTSPTNTATEVADGARAIFEKEEAEQLFTGLGLHEGGFQANASHVYMLDDKGNFVPAPPYDALKDNGMAAAAQDGRLYIMDKNFRLRQVRLEGNENDGFAFAATKPLSRKQRPMGLMSFYAKQLSTIFNDFVSDVKRAWTEADKRQAERRNRVEKFFDRWIKRAEKNSEKALADMKRVWSNVTGFLSGRKKETKQAEVKVEEGSLIPEDEPVQTQQTVSSPKEEQIQQTQPEQNKEKTVDELLKTPPTQQTTPEFEKYMEALVQRRNEGPVKAALEKEGGKPADYYEALAQELEGKIAGDILRVAPTKESDPAGREKFLDAQKPVMASISKGLRDFVETKIEPELVGDYYKAHAGKDEGVKADLDTKKTNLRDAAARLVSSGVGEYMASVQKQNAATRQAMQPSTPSQQVQKQQTAPELKQAKPATPGMNGR